MHSDLCGPISVESIGGAKYFITFIDDYSRKMFVYFIKNKSDACNKFKEFKALVENETGNKILRTDNGRKYLNNEFVEILKNSGIKHQTTISYNPQQNGLAERTNRTSRACEEYVDRRRSTQEILGGSYIDSNLFNKQISVKSYW